MRLFHKFLISFLMVGVIVLLAVSWMSYQDMKRSLFDSAMQHLVTARESKKREIESYFDSLQKLTLSFSANLMTSEALARFTQAFDALQRENVDTGLNVSLKHFYLDKVLEKYQKNTGVNLAVENLLPTEPGTEALQQHYVLKHFMNHFMNEASLDAELAAYKNVHQHYHGIFETDLKRYGLYDIFLIDTSGNIVYSVFKEIDFATNLLSGPYRDSGLGQLARKLLQDKGSNYDGLQVVVSDFAPYLPSYGKPAAFLASPVIKDNKVTGIFALQVSIDRVNQIMTSNRNWSKEGFGESGETYIVGRDYGMRNDSRFLIEDRDRYLQMLRSIGVNETIVNKISRFNTSIYNQKVESEAVRRALAGVTDKGVVLDYRGVPVLSAYMPLQIPGMDWVLLSEKDEQEVLAPLEHYLNRLFIVFALVLVVVTVAAVAVAHRITNPVSKVIKTVSQVSKGQYWRAVDVEGDDELAQLGLAINDMANNITQAETANEGKSVFLSTMSHELKTPLNAIIGFGEFLQSDPRLEADMQDCLQEITRAAHHLLSMSNEAIKYVTLEERSEQLTVSIHLKSLVDTCLIHCREKVQEKALRIQNQVAEELVINAYETDLCDVLNILLSNAIEYTRPSSAVTILALSAGKAVSIDVIDEGEGIAAENLQEIFKPFTRLDKSSSDISGIGLGLAIARRIADRRKWKISVNSNPGSGSVFTVTLP